MNKIFTNLFAAILLIGMVTSVYAGNPDRQGEAGAYQLIMNPWAKSASWHSMSTSFVSGVDAMRINVAGLSRINKLEVGIAYTNYLRPSDVSINALGLAKKIGENGVLGISIMSVNVGDINVTTVDAPEGTGATYSPNLFNMGIGYSYSFEQKISVGVLFRTVSESISDASAFAFGLDAGVQYVTGDKDEFKFGIALRNVGSKMRFAGGGLGLANPDGVRTDIQSASSELPSLLNIGASYDFIFSSTHRITVVGNFTANSYSNDEVGGGVEYSFNEMFAIRAAYKFDGRGELTVDKNNAYTGLSAGASFDFDISKNEEAKTVTKMAVDYAYRPAFPFSGTHNVTLSIKL